MDIRFVAKFNMADVEKNIQGALERQGKAIEAFLENAGEIFEETAKANADFMNHTFRLRSSIGYGITKDKVVIKESFQAISTGDEGAEMGRKALAQAVSELTLDKGYALIGIAGENYAAAVEAKGRDVITGTSQTIQNLLEQALGKAK